MLTITPVCAFSDNYIWIIQSSKSSAVYVVDPGQAKPVIDYISSHNLSLAGILITHHHLDHTGGIEALVQYAGNIPVFGSASENIPWITQPLIGNENLILPQLNVETNVISVPGHTLGHIAYLLDDNLFCGDTLFSGGCGRLFEGTPAQMHHSLSILKQLDDETNVYCAHEYTLNNLKFALAIEPENQALIEHINWCQQQRSTNKPTLPSTIGKEKQINPFLRTEHPCIRTQLVQYTNASIINDVEAFANLRQWKDKF